MCLDEGRIFDAQPALHPRSRRSYLGDQERHTGEKPAQARWSFNDRIGGELLAHTKQRCTELVPSCVEEFVLTAPGIGGVSPGNRQVKMASSFITYQSVDSNGRPYQFRADSPAQFFTDVDWHNQAFHLTAKADPEVSEGFIDAPEFGWFEEGEKQTFSNIGAFRIRFRQGDTLDNKNDSIPVPNFVPTIAQFSKLLSGAELSHEIPIAYVSRHSFGKTDQRIIQGKVSYTITVEHPGKLAVTPGDFHAHRRSPKQPYKPRSKTYVLTNTGSRELEYAVSDSASWLEAIPSDGTLPPKGQTQIVVALTKNADALKVGSHEATIRFDNRTFGGTDTRKAVLSDNQMWRVTIFQRNDLFFGSARLYGGMTARLRTDIEFEIESGKLKHTNGVAKFTSIKALSSPPSVFHCIVFNNGNHIVYPNYTASGKLIGKQIVLDIPKNSYNVRYHCNTDTDQLRDYYKGWYQKSKPKAKHGVRLPKNWDKLVEQWAAADAKAVTLYKEDKFTKPLYPNPSPTLSVPLKDGYYQAYGNDESIDFEAVKVQRLD